MLETLACLKIHFVVALLWKPEPTIPALFCKIIILRLAQHLFSKLEFIDINLWMLGKRHWPLGRWGTMNGEKE